MVEPEQDKFDVVRLGGKASNEKLAYRIELWNEPRGDAVERLLARALNAQLARAIFRAVLAEHPGRRITLRSGARLLADSRDTESSDRAV
jgi:hypothetical protein